MGTEEIYLNIIKAIYDKPTASIILNSQKSKAFLLRLETNKGVPTYHSYSTVVLEVLVRAISQEKEIKDIQTRKDGKLFLQIT